MDGALNKSRVVPELAPIGTVTGCLLEPLLLLLPDRHSYKYLGYGIFDLFQLYLYFIDCVLVDII